MKKITYCCPVGLVFVLLHIEGVSADCNLSRQQCKELAGTPTAKFSVECYKYTYEVLEKEHIGACVDICDPEDRHELKCSDQCPDFTYHGECPDSSTTTADPNTHQTVTAPENSKAEEKEDGVTTERESNMALWPTWTRDVVLLLFGASLLVNVYFITMRCKQLGGRCNPGPPKRTDESGTTMPMIEQGQPIQHLTPAGDDNTDVESGIGSRYTITS